jgi:hypothetical protein
MKDMNLRLQSIKKVTILLLIITVALSFFAFTSYTHGNEAFTVFFLMVTFPVFLATLFLGLFYGFGRASIFFSNNR